MIFLYIYVNRYLFLPCTESANFYTYPEAISHGLLIFQRTLEYYGLSTIQIFQELKSVHPYFSEDYSRMSIEFPATDATELLSCILHHRDFLLKEQYYTASGRNSPSEVFGVLYLLIAVPNTPEREEKAETTAGKSLVSFNLRKSPASLSSRSIANVSKMIILAVDEKVGVEKSVFF